jgi:hypothetical protein
MSDDPRIVVFPESRSLSLTAVTQKCKQAFERSQRSKDKTEMGRQVAVVLYVVAMAALIIGVDFAFLRNGFWERLAVNIGIVLVPAAFYFRFLRPS